MFCSNGHVEMICGNYHGKSIREREAFASLVFHCKGGTFPPTTTTIRTANRKKKSTLEAN